MLRVQDYSLDEIFKNKLYVLLPFYILKYEDRIANLEDEQDSVERDNLIEEYNQIVQRLRDDVTKEVFIDIFHEILLILEYVLRNANVTRRKVVDIMKRGEARLNYSEELKEQGRQEILIELIQKKIARSLSLEQIAVELEESVEDIRPLYDAVIRKQLL